jgi:hypothetical protein
MAVLGPSPDGEALHHMRDVQPDDILKRLFKIIFSAPDKMRCDAFDAKRTLGIGDNSSLSLHGVR